MRGTGLGLSIARRHMTLMGGDLELEDSAEAGSLFSINLPLPSAQIAARPAGMTVVTQRLSAGQHVRALVVDDGRENRDVLSTMLGMAGCETAVAEDCRQAIDLVCEFQPDMRHRSASAGVGRSRDYPARAGAQRTPLPCGRDIGIRARMVNGNAVSRLVATSSSPNR